MRERKMLFEASFNSSVCTVPMIVLLTTETRSAGAVPVEIAISDSPDRCSRPRCCAGSKPSRWRRANRTEIE